MMLDPNDLIADFLSEDSRDVLKAITQIRKMEKEAPSSVGPVAWRALIHIDGRPVVGECIELWKLLMRVWGRKDLENHVRHEWEAMGEKGRMNMCYAAYIPEAMSTRLLLHLFDHPASTVTDRHLLAKGLVRTANQRNMEDLVMNLIFRIGRYPDTARQKELDAFVEEARLRFAPPPSGPETP